jgi:hypothetical protein
MVRLTLTLLTWRIRWAPNNASRLQMGFNSAFKDWRLGLLSSPVQGWIVICKWPSKISPSFLFHLTTEIGPVFETRCGVSSLANSKMSVTPVTNLLCSYSIHSFPYPREKRLYSVAYFRIFVSKCHVLVTGVWHKSAVTLHFELIPQFLWGRWSI